MSKKVVFENKILGRGRKSVVCEGIYNNKKCAIKIINKTNINSLEQKLLNKEIEILKLLKVNPHKNIITIYEIEENNTHYKIYMEYMKFSLQNLVGRPIKEEIVKYFAKNIINGITHLLKLNIVHRDIKPSNILTTENISEVKIIDFGLSEIINNKFNPELTFKCGSPNFMSPEINQGKHYNNKTDIWSLGVTIYFLLFGYSPFNKEIDYIDSDDLEFNNKVNKISKNCKNILRQMITSEDKRIEWFDLQFNNWFHKVIESDSNYNSTDSDNSETLSDVMELIDGILINNNNLDEELENINSI